MSNKARSIRREMERLRAELDKAESIPNGRLLEDGTVLVFEVDIPPSRKRYTYVALKAGGAWYMTGQGKVPRQAGWGVVEDWLTDPGRDLVSIRIVDRLRKLKPEDFEDLTSEDYRGVAVQDSGWTASDFMTRDVEIDDGYDAYHDFD